MHDDLNYDALARNFNFDGGQVGAYATYLNGGLFVDTLLNVHLYSLETSTLGFPNSLEHGRLAHRYRLPLWLVLGGVHSRAA